MRGGKSGGVWGGGFWKETLCWQQNFKYPTRHYTPTPQAEAGLVFTISLLARASLFGVVLVIFTLFHALVRVLFHSASHVIAECPLHKLSSMLYLYFSITHSFVHLFNQQVFAEHMACANHYLRKRDRTLKAWLPSLQESLLCPLPTLPSPRARVPSRTPREKDLSLKTAFSKWICFLICPLWIDFDCNFQFEPNRLTKLFITTSEGYFRWGLDGNSNWGWFEHLGITL